MSKNETTSKIIDEILLFGVTGAALTGSLVVPNLLIALEKPLKVFWHHMDRREKERQLRRVLYAMKERGLLSGDYDHGLQLTDKARQRLAKRAIVHLKAKSEKVWDKKWRIIIYDIPEDHQTARQILADRLRDYGCFLLQRSTWITPFACREDIATITAHYDVDKYVSYFEAFNLDNAAAMIRRFQKKYPSTKFL